MSEKEGKEKDMTALNFSWDLETNSSSALRGQVITDQQTGNKTYNLGPNSSSSQSWFTLAIVVAGLFYLHKKRKRK